MNLLNDIHHKLLPERLIISSGMLKSEYLPYEAADLVVKLYQDQNSDDLSFAQKLRALPTHWGAIEPLMYYDSMVNNGGHEQYFKNSDGAYLDLVEDGLKLFASDYHLWTFQRALFRYDPIFHSSHGHLEESAPSFKDPVNIFDDLDDLYFDAKSKLPALVDQYIRNNLALFTS